MARRSAIRGAQESFLKCKECKHRLEQQAKPEFLANGLWQPTNANADPQESRGFYANQLYSSTISPGELVIAHLRGQGDEVANTEFHNSKLGLPFIGENAQVTDAMLDNAVRKHSILDMRPAVGGRRRITMGVDQGKTGYISIVEWKFDGDPRIDINLAAVGTLLWFGKFREDDWNYLGQLMREWQVLACVVDADPNINDARRFARTFYGYVHLTRYRRGQTAKEVAISEEETGAPMATVDRTNWLSCTLGRFKSNPSRLLLPADISVEYRDHLKNLVRTYEKDDHGNPEAVYVETGPDHYAPQSGLCRPRADVRAVVRRLQHWKSFVMKRCSHCHCVKPVRAFHNDRRQKDGKARECRACASKRVRSRSSAQNRAYNLKSKHGITLADYERMLSQQGGKCAICGSLSPGQNETHFHVDHDHLTGRVRGFLCERCNVGIGYFDDPAGFEAAAQYLRDHV